MINKRRRILSAFCLMFLFSANSVQVQAQSQQSLDEAIQNGVRYLQSRFPRGTRAAFAGVQSENQQVGEFVYERFSNVLVNSGWFTVVERNSASLANIDQEMDRHLNFLVSEETELSIGRQLGAEILIICSLNRLGQNWRLDLHATRVESAERAGQWSAENIRHDQALDAILRASSSGSRSAVISFEGDAMTARDMNTVTAGMRNAMQAWNTALVLEEGSSNQGGYVFNITVYRNQAPANPSLIQAEVSVSFMQGRRILHQAGPYYITETSEIMIARRIAERLRADQAFFNRINETIR